MRTGNVSHLRALRRLQFPHPAATGSANLSSALRQRNLPVAAYLSHCSGKGPPLQWTRDHHNCSCRLGMEHGACMLASWHSRPTLTS